MIPMLSSITANLVHGPLADEVIRRQKLQGSAIIDRKGNLKFAKADAQAVLEYAAALPEDLKHSLSELELCNGRPYIVRAGYEALGIKAGAKDPRQRQINMAAVGLALTIANFLEVRYHYKF